MSRTNRKRRKKWEKYLSWVRAEAPHLLEEHELSSETSEGQACEVPQCAGVLELVCA